MKTKITLNSFLLSGAIIFVLTLFSQKIQAETVIWSDDFESYADAASAGTAGFTVWEGSGVVTDVTVTLVGTAHSGNKYLLGTRSNTINKTFYFRKTAAVTLVEGSTYILEAWVKSPNGMTVKTGVKLGTAADVSSTQTTTSATWTKLSQSFTVGVGQSSVIPMIQMYSYAIANKVHVDDMRILLAYNIAASGTNGTVAGAGFTAEGTNASLIATPSIGYHFVNWTDGGIEVSTNPTYTFNVTATRTLVANFAVGTSSVAVSETTRSGFAYIYGAGSSTEQSFSVSGENLSGDIILTPSANYEISTTTGGSFAATNPITLSKVSSSVATTTIYARLKAGLSVNSYNTENITIASAGVTTQNVACSGSVVQKELTITAANQAVNFGTAIATVTEAGTYTPAGFVNGEDASVITGSVTYSTNYTDATPAATSGITITPIVTGLSATNYSFTAVDGTITISTVTNIDNILKANGLNTVGMSIVNGNLTMVNILPLSTVRVFDGLGRKVVNKIANGSVMEIKLNARGIYTIQLQSGTSIFTRKIIF